MKTTEQKARQFIKLVRGFCVPSNIPVVVIKDSDERPKLKGESWHFETLGGERISHPSAYRKIGWKNMRYVESSRRIEVGENFGGWLGGYINVDGKIV